jgi:aminopeptidase N
VQGAAPLAAAPQASKDPRTAYDVLGYRLDVHLDPARTALRATVAVDARVTAKSLQTLVLDLDDGLKVEAVRRLPSSFNVRSPLRGDPVSFKHEDDRLVCTLDEPVGQREYIRVAVTYSGTPGSLDDFTGFHWKTTSDGQPWIGTSFQMIGAHHWFPCKASFFHPEDKPARVIVNLDVPEGLVGVSNGHLVEREVNEGREVFRWLHEYPLGTYAITLNVAPYVSIEKRIYIPGLADDIQFSAYVLPENLEKAHVQFREVPTMLKVFSLAFGPYPFPESKFGLVETSFWGMEHSTAVAYGSSYPAWCKANDQPDPFAARNQFFDYILIHESAHEWWGNAVTASAWGDFWIQEGFATYAESIYVEETQGREAVDRYFDSQRRMIRKGSRLHGGQGLASAKEAYSSTIYTKGAWVLHTLRHYIADDDAWWRAIRSFYESHRYENASTNDFRRALERSTKKDWGQFFDEWIFGEGYPKLSGTVEADGTVVRIRIDNEGSGATDFHIPLDLQWYEGVRQVRERIWLDPGENTLDLERETEVVDLTVRDLQRVLGTHDVKVR